MAEDSRETKQSHPAGPPPGATSPPAHITEPKIYEVFHAPPSANALPDGYGQNTAGGHPEVVSLSDAAKTVKLEDFKNIHTIPCARESLLTAIGSAFAVGGTRALLGASIPKAANWAVGTFCFMGLGAYEYCLQKRRLEKVHMKRAVEIIDRKKAEKEAQMQASREARRKAREEKERAEEEAKKSSWRFW